VSEFRSLLSKEFLPFGTLSEDQLTILERHYALLVQWNQRMNLTRIEKLEDVVRLHYCESLFLGRQLPGGALRIMDIGSGAGFPGFPVAILRPDCSFDLVESDRRKAVFLREACVAPNVRVLAERAETLEGGYDWVVSRAVRPVDVTRSGLAPNVAMLLNCKDAQDAAGVVRCPWGVDHVVALFHVKQ
jgi:16S rRNA (guanine(527)-N(7))-methyltransferase RsmG